MDAAPVDDVACPPTIDRHGRDDRKEERVADRAQRTERGTGVGHGRHQGLCRVRIHRGQRAPHGEHALTCSIPELHGRVERVPRCEASESRVGGGARRLPRVCQIRPDRRLVSRLPNLGGALRPSGFQARHQLRRNALQLLRGGGERDVPNLGVGSPGEAPDHE